MPKVSACIITYNQENYIRNCINGALMQKLTCDYEIIIGDDFSNDATSEICREYAKRHPDIIKYYPRTKNIGMNGNWLRSICECDGDYIAICEGDDYWTDPYKLQKQVDFLDANNEYSLCFCSAKVLFPNGDLIYDNEVSLPKVFHRLEDMARFGNYIRTPSILFKNVLTDQDLNLLKKTPAVDFPLYLILGQYGYYGYIDEPMVVYRKGFGIWSSLATKQSTLGFLITIIYAKEYFLNKNVREEIVDILNNGIRYFVNSVYPDLKPDDLNSYLLDDFVIRELLLAIISVKPEIKKKNQFILLISTINNKLTRIVNGISKLTRFHG